MKKIAGVVYCILVAAPLLAQRNAWANSVGKAVRVSAAVAAGTHLKAVANQTSYEIRRK